MSGCRGELAASNILLGREKQNAIVRGALPGADRRAEGIQLKFILDFVGVGGPLLSPPKSDLTRDLQCLARFSGSALFQAMQCSIIRASRPVLDDAAIRRYR